MNTNELVKKNLLTILSAIAIIAMFLTFLSFSAETEYSDVSNTITGIQACEYSIFGYLLIVGPVLLIAMNYIKQLEKYKGILSISVPCICLFTLVVVFFQAKAGYQAGAGAAADIASSFGVEMEYSTSVGLGMILVAVSYIAMIIFGIKTQHDFSISKPNMESIKSVGAEFMKNAQSSVSKAAQNISSNISIPTTNSKKHVDEILELIEKLAKMKDEGILSEEEFKEKKTKLLEDI